MTKSLAELDGGYRFLIPPENLIIGSPSKAQHPNHQEIATILGYNPEETKGGYAEIFTEDGITKVLYTGEAFSVPKALEQDLTEALEQKKPIIIFDGSKSS